MRIAKNSSLQASFPTAFSSAFHLWPRLAALTPLALVGALALTSPIAAQTAETAAIGAPTLSAAIVPQMIRTSGTLAGHAGETLDATFAIFTEQKGGEPLWSETQRVTISADGSYTVYLGAANENGLSQAVFSAGQARWLGVTINKEQEEAQELPRTQLASVPYAMKSADAASLGGRSASDYVTREELQATNSTNSSNSEFNPLTGGTVTGTGTTNYIPVWTGTLTQGNSAIYQSGTNVGINTTTPQTSFDVNGTFTARSDMRLNNEQVATASGARASPLGEFISSSYSSTLAAAVPQSFAWQSVGESNNTATPTGILELLAGSGATYLSPTATGLSISATGGVTFAKGQGYLSFPLNAATAATSYNSPSTQWESNAYSSSTSASVAQNFTLRAVASGNDTASPTGNLELFAGSGSGASNPAFTGLSIAPTGVITFAAGQNFPLTTLETELDAVYPQLATANTFALGATFGGPVFASSATSGTSAVTATGTNGAYGITATSDTGNAGSFGNNNAADATIYSINSASFDGSYIPVAINATASGTDAVGAYGAGTLSGLFGLSDTAIGVWGVAGGISNLPTVTGTGVYGQGTTGVLGQGSQTGVAGAASAGPGVWGVAGTLSGTPTLTSTGVEGNATDPAFGNAGVLGFTGSTQSATYAYEVGRLGVAGVWGDTTGNPNSSSDFSAAVMGTTDAYDGYGGAFIASSEVTVGVYGKNIGTGTVTLPGGTGGSGGTGVEGISPSPAEGKAGVLGNVYQFSNTYGTVETTGPVGFVAGVWGDSGEVNDGTGTYTAGVVGTGDDITAGVFENNSGHPTLSVTNLGSGGQGLFKTLMASTKDGTCGIGDGGNLSCTGQVKALVSTGGGARTVETYAPQSAENWMEDYGTGVMERGVSVVKIDPAFAETVTADANYHVFITPRGDSEGLYVINATPTSFEVRESRGGTSSLTFDYKIVAKRRGYEAQRLVDVTERFNAERKAALPVQGTAVPHKADARLLHMTGPGDAMPSASRAEAKHAPVAAKAAGPAVRVGGGGTQARNIQHVAVPKP